MKKCRIIKRTMVNRSVIYVIQQKSWLFGWRDAWLNSWDGAACRDNFATLEEAIENLCYFNGLINIDEEISVNKEEVVVG